MNNTNIQSKNNNLQIKRFDMRSIEFKSNSKSEGPVIVMIGKRGTGKSLVVKDLLSHHRSIPLGCVISGTEIGNHFYQSIVPRMLIHNTYSSNVIENILRRQYKMITHPIAHMDSRCFLILDDCLYDDKWVRDKLMRLVFMNGRHWKVMLIFTMQYPLGVPPALRTNIDLFYEKQSLEIEKNYMITMPVSFPHLIIFVKYWIIPRKIMNVL
jgi:hypothetical protein